MRSSRPAAGAGISTSILSVVTSQMGSSASIQSPGRFRHSTIVPSATETPIWGMTTSTAVVACSVGEELTAGLLHVVELREHRLLERWAERDRDVGGGKPSDWSVEILECLLDDDRSDLGADAGRPRRLVRDQHLAGLACAREDRFA